MHSSSTNKALQRRKYAPNGVFLVTHILFLPSLCADRGPVADTERGTTGKGRAGANFRISAFLSGAVDFTFLAAAVCALDCFVESLACSALALASRRFFFLLEIGASWAFEGPASACCEVGSSTRTRFCVRSGSVTLASLFLFIVNLSG